MTRLTRTSSCAALAACVLFAIVSQPLAARAGDTFSIHEPRHIFMGNPCVPDAGLEIVGTRHLVLGFNQTPTGATTFKFHVNFNDTLAYGYDAYHIDGDGNLIVDHYDGTVYRVVRVFNETVVSDPGVPRAFNFNEIDAFREVSTGDEIRVRITEQIRFDETGAVLEDRYTYTIDC
jgi:hypothetical protein